jgi:hypothetical protein
MGPLLAESGGNFGSPALGQLFERTHIEIAIVKERFELRHQSRHEATILTNAVTTHRR